MSWMKKTTGDCTADGSKASAHWKPLERIEGGQDGMDVKLDRIESSRTG